jgi:COP9 signalosome complex subunit 5
MMESLEKRRKEGFVGWYHSHPFDVGVHSNCFFSNTDVQMQTTFQMSMPYWVGIVVDPLRSIAKQVPEFSAFRCYPPSAAKGEKTPDGVVPEDKEAAIARWGHSYYNYYELAIEPFMSSLASNFLNIMSRYAFERCVCGWCVFLSLCRTCLYHPHSLLLKPPHPSRRNSLWIRTLSTSAATEQETVEQFPKRIGKAVQGLEDDAKSRGGGGGGGYGSSSLFPSRKKEVSALSENVQACSELAIEQCQSQSAQIGKFVLFNALDGQSKPQSDDEQ